MWLVRYLHKVVDNSYRNDNCGEKWSSQTDHKQSSQNSEKTQNPGSEGHGDHLIHSKYILKMSEKTGVNITIDEDF